MRIQDNETVSPSCQDQVNTMEPKDVSGGTTTPNTEIKFPPNTNDTANANGILSPPTTPSTTTPSESDYASSASASGRFKFFKDGKFILELWHHKNGERMYWIPVSKNSTYWPPTGHITPRQESSTSLSVSDDNSSIHSSPWQRDHCWKQTLPRKNINRELEFRMHFSRPRKMRFSSAVIRRRRRRPYDLIKFELIEKIKNEMKEDMEEKSISSQESINKERGTTNPHLNNRKLNVVIKKLLERTKDNPTSSCRTDPGIVSPRKRILREMERVSLEEMGNSNKKHRARNVTINAANNVMTVVAGSVSGPVTIVTTPIASTTSTKSTSSHSISSILSRDEEPSFLRNLLKSPTDPSSEAAARNTSMSSSLSSTAEVISSNDIRISRPTHCSTPVTSSLSPPYPPKGLHCPQPIAPYIPSAYLYPNAQMFLTSPPISNHPPYYSTLRHSWCMPSLSSLPRQSVYSSSSVTQYPPVNSSSWVPVAHSSLQNYPVSENGADVPLNLSKH